MDSNSEIKNPGPQAYVGMACLLIVFLWGWWFIEHFTDIRLGPGGSRPREQPLEIWIPVIGSPLLLLGSIIWWKRSAGIAANGVIVDALIEGLGAKAGAMRNVTLSYTVDGRTYQAAKSVGLADLGDRQPGDTLPLVVDKRNPKRFIVRD